MTEVPEDIREFAAIVAKRLREHFPADEERIRQDFALAEEAGEFIGAYRRAKGMARRRGSWDDVAAELADVLITAYVTAEVNGFEARPLRHYGTHGTGNEHEDVMDVYLGVAEYVRDAMEGRVMPDVSLRAAIGSAVRAAHTLGIDLNAAWRSKAERVLTRGWRESA